MKLWRFFLYALLPFCMLEMHAQTFYEVKVNQLDILEKPNLSAKVIGTLKMHDIVEVYNISMGWAKIKYQEATGYVEADGIQSLEKKDSKNEVEPLPSVESQNTETTIYTQNITQQPTPGISTKRKKHGYDEDKKVRYKGFADLDGGFPIDGYANGYLGLQTTHGIQLKSCFFIGAGFGFERLFYWEEWFAPIMGNIRYNLPNKKISPFVDFKGGYNMALDLYSCGFLSASVGIRFKLNNRMGLNLSMAYTMIRYYEDNSYYGLWYYDDIYRNANHLGFRLGIDF